MRFLAAIVMAFVILSLCNYAWYDHKLTAIETLIRSTVTTYPFVNPLSALATHQAEAEREYKYFIVREVVLGLVTIAAILVSYRRSKADG
jgi:hypothetical protein